VLGSLLLPARLEKSKIVSLGLLLGFMSLILIAIGGTYGGSWLVCLVSGICSGALGETSVSPTFLVNDWVKIIYFCYDGVL
jgi:hypothetical protein